MMSRLVLVGMVAALGISVPTRPEIQRWMSDIHSWTASRLAAWDVSARRVDDSIEVTPSPERPCPYFEPIVLDDRASGIADELNRLAEGLDIRPEAMIVRRRREGQATKDPATTRFRREFSGVPAIDTPELKLMAGLLEAVERSNGEAEWADSQVSCRRSKPLSHPIECTFTASAAVAPIRPVLASRGDTGPGPARRHLRTEPIEPLADAALDVAGALNRFAEGIHVESSDPATARASKPAFEPIDPASPDQMSLADELNRASEGLIIARATPGGDHSRAATSVSGRTSDPPAPGTDGNPSPPGPSPEVTQAMRLTRDAVRAWMRVMTGPAFVQVSAR